jgi:FkbM family methyltransferase
VVAIEANPNSYSLLSQNVVLNGATNCRAIHLAASDRAETLRFLLSRANSGGSKRVPKNKEYMYYSDGPEEVSVPAHDLDGFLEDHDFDVVVMDIEGSEYFALKGMQSILSRAKLLVVEFLPHHLRNVSGVTIEQFLSVIAPHFTRLTIGRKNLTVGRDEFQNALTEMYDRDEGDDGIMFEKA